MVDSTIIQILFWLLIFLVFYAYLGYGIVLFGLIKLKRLFTPKPAPPSVKEEDWPAVTFMVAAYNEARWIKDKIQNCLDFDYPANKIYFFFVTDGSDDETPDLIKNYDLPEGVQLQLFHRPERRGKIAAVDRVMEFVKTPIVIYTDANTFVNPMAVRNIVRHYQNPKVGAVAGEKRIQLSQKDEASSAGEGIYWKYESQLKKWDSELYSVVGAAGELFSIRVDLFESVPQDTVIEDFYMTLRIAQKGYRVIYEPDAYAVESSSASVGEELKRKIRIAAGGLQAISRLLPLLNFFKYGILSFQYISHRVLRWTLAPLALPLILLINIYLALQGIPFYQILLVLQIGFYVLAAIGYLMERRKLKFKAFFIPYYFCMMNYAVFRGFGRFVKGSQSVVWERAKRA
ncbi:MAG: glycosyltransferase family 2 protein [Saprospiraceae bacterium]|nr:glycosyltransferase family 2 protein [Saprospiraceae bacterium]